MVPLTSLPLGSVLSLASVLYSGRSMWLVSTNVQVESSLFSLLYVLDRVTAVSVLADAALLVGDDPGQLLRAVPCLKQ